MKRQEQGVALIAAIFLVVVIGSALVILASLSLRDSQQTTQSLLKTRASLAASAGIEASTQRLVTDSSGSYSWCDGSTVNVNVPAYTGFTVSVVCRLNHYNRPSQQITIFTLNASAEYGSESDSDYVWTESSATLEL